MSETKCSESDLNVLLAAFELLLNAVIDYDEYEHDGDPWSEDRRAMGEMDIDDLRRSGDIDKCKEIMQKFKGS